MPADQVAWGLVEATVDYRVRYQFTIALPERLVAAKGAGRHSGVPLANLSTQLTILVANNYPYETSIQTFTSASTPPPNRFASILVWWDTRDRFGTAFVVRSQASSERVKSLRDS